MLNDDVVHASDIAIINSTSPNAISAIVAISKVKTSKVYLAVFNRDGVDVIPLIKLDAGAGDVMDG